MPLGHLADLSGSELSREIANYRWNKIVETAHAARRLESKERTKRLDDLQHGSEDEQMAYRLVKKLDEYDKLHAEDIKERKLAARERKREAWSRQKGS